MIDPKKGGMGRPKGLRYTGDMRAQASPVPVLVELPPSASSEAPELLSERLRRLLVFDEVRLGRITRAGGARLLGLGLDAFLREASAHGVLALDYEPADFEQELGSIRAAVARA
jgi:hypothetical protein